MHPLHDYIARQVADRIKDRRVVVWYDSRADFAPFVAELRGAPEPLAAPATVVVGDRHVTLIDFRGSLLDIRAQAEPFVGGTEPADTLIYIPAAQDTDGSLLMELEKAGTAYSTSLRRLARFQLRERFTDGQIDDLIEHDSVTYANIARAAEGGGTEPPSILKSIFHETPQRDDLLAMWLASDARDAEIATKGATAELVKLVSSRLGLDLDAGNSLDKSRAIAARYMLATEFAADFEGAAPPTVASIAAARKDLATACSAVADKVRAQHKAAYIHLADQVEDELGLASAAIAATSLGSTDTFRFEERALLSHAESLIAAGHFVEAETVARGRDKSFWLLQQAPRGLQWQACRLMARLGAVAAQVAADAAKTHGNPEAWIGRYADRENGWYRLDGIQRQLETLLTGLDEDPDDIALARVRRAYDDAVTSLANGFIGALGKSGWSVGQALHQTRVFSEIVQAQPKPVAYFLVDAMRYEMGVALADRPWEGAEVRIRPAVCALPSITPIGMAALMPGAAASFDIAESGGKFGARIDGEFLPGLPTRQKLATSRIPGLVDLELAEVLTLSSTKLASKVAGAQIVIARSQEIDAAGEKAFYQARRTMDTVIEDLARAVRKLATAGIRHAVLSADHGHLFSHADLPESHRVDPPGGNTVDLHRRCWIGHGGATPSGCIRVAATALGYESELELVFPPSAGVFKAGGDLGYHHGGPTLQELVIPVVTIRSGAPTAAAKAEPVTVKGAPDKITNRIFSITISRGGANLSLFSEATTVQPVLMAGAVQVGKAAMAVGAPFDAGAGTVTLPPKGEANVGFILSDDSVASIRVVVLDPATDRELYRSPEIPVSLGVA